MSKQQLSHRATLFFYGTLALFITLFLLFFVPTSLPAKLRYMVIGGAWLVSQVCILCACHLQERVITHYYLKH